MMSKQQKNRKILLTVKNTVTLNQVIYVIGISSNKILAS